MSKKRSISHIIEEEFKEKKRPKRKVRLENNKQYKDYVCFEEESLSQSLSTLSISDDSSSIVEEIEDEEPLLLDSVDYKAILADENTQDSVQFEVLSQELTKICNHLNDKKVTLTKILQSNLQTYEKERAVELFGVLFSIPEINSLEYIQLNKTLHDMIDNSSLQNKDESIDKKLKALHDKMIYETPTLDKIMNAPISDTDRMMAVEYFNTFYHLGLSHGGLYSQEWFSLRKKINMIIDRKIKNKKEYDELEKREAEIKKYELNEQHDLKKKILNLEAPLHIKKIIYQLYEEMICDTDQKDLLTHKLKLLTNLPHQKVLNRKFDFVHIYNQLNEKIYGMNQVKEQLLLHLNNKQHDKKNNKIISLSSAPGVGKTTLIKLLAEITNTPFEKINFGGNIDSSIILGSHTVWSGAGPSLILQMMARQGYSDIMILLDEIDKLGCTDKGFEVQNALLQILDYTQNDAFNDNYLDYYPHDLSRIWFIATMNDETLLSQPLRDRLDIIKLPSYNKQDMINIIKNYTLPQACLHCGLTKTDLSIKDSACTTLLHYMYKDVESSGMRLIEQQINSLVSKISFLHQHKNISLSFKLDDFNDYPYVIKKLTIKALILHKPDKPKYMSMYG